VRTTNKAHGRGWLKVAGLYVDIIHGGWGEIDIAKVHGDR